MKKELKKKLTGFCDSGSDFILGRVDVTRSPADTSA